MMKLRDGEFGVLMPVLQEKEGTKKPKQNQKVGK
jgi:hypothetical protein